jgi:8-oxo-dGTP pyrophosphatase MutT (NUDIX family)
MTEPPHAVIGELAERARAFLDAGRPPVAPVDAATVVLLRDGIDGAEVYLLRRRRTMAFASGMYVFPGGRVDPRDAELDRLEGARVEWAGPPPDAWARRLAEPEPLAYALVCAAARETFEESRVLLAGTADPTIVTDLSGDDWERDRKALVAHELSLSELLRRRGLVLRSDLLAAWTRWITPEFEPLRYDTRFFIAGLPQGQRALPVGEEEDRAEWLRPSVALERHARGELPMLPPTLVTLAEIAGHASVADILRTAASRPLAPILPRAVLLADEVQLLLPGERGYET